MSPVLLWTRRHPVIAYFLIAYALSWGVWVPMAMAGVRVSMGQAVTGLLWAPWHVPSMVVLENYRQMGVALVPLFTLGIVSGSILLAWLYRGSGGSVLLVALWHGSYNLVSGTAGAGDVPAAVVSTAVMVWAAAIVVAELRRTRRAHQARRGHGGRDESAPTLRPRPAAI